MRVDPGRPVPIAEIVLFGAHDDFAGICAGFPSRSRPELSDDPESPRVAAVAADRTAADVPNPGVAPLRFRLDEATARFVRLAATRLAKRKDDSILAPSGLQAFTPDVLNAAAESSVTAMGPIEVPTRRGVKYPVDGVVRGPTSPASASRWPGSPRVATPCSPGTRDGDPAPSGRG